MHKLEVLGFYTVKSEIISHERLRITQMLNQPEMDSTLLYKVPSNSTGKKRCYKRILLLPVEFMTKYFKEVFDP